MYDASMLDALEAELHKLCGMESSALRDGETIKRLHRSLARLDALTTKATEAFDSAKAWDADAGDAGEA